MLEQLNLYNNIFTYGSFFVAVIYCLYLSSQEGLYKNKNLIFALILLIALTILFGTTPYDLGRYSGDRMLYADNFQHAEKAKIERDIFWGYYNKLFHPFLTLGQWFILTAFFYLLGFFEFARRETKGFTTAMFICMITFLFFQNYAVNTMRGGLAASILFYALTWRDKNRIVCYILLFVATQFHGSMWLPAATFVLSSFFPQTRFYFAFWLLCIPVSFAFGGFFQTFFRGWVTDFQGTQAGNYLLGNDVGYKTGFRIDFIVYSLIPGLMAYYYIFRRKIKDAFYRNIFNTYLIANGIWILVIRSSFSDRLAYLSWVFIPILILYPALKYKLWQNQNRKVALIIFLQALFTFTLSLR